MCGWPLRIPWNCPLPPWGRVYERRKSPRPIWWAPVVFSVGCEMDIAKRRGRWMSATLRQYHWRDEHISQHYPRGAFSTRINGRSGGNRTRTAPDAHQRLVAISKCMSGALRRRQLPGMADEGCAYAYPPQSKGIVRPKCNVRRYPRNRQRRGGNLKRRLEMGRDRCSIWRSQFQSVGSGVRPDCLPVASGMNYLAHGASLDASMLITCEGLPRSRRLNIHLYECGRNGDVV